MVRKEGERPINKNLHYTPSRGSFNCTTRDKPARTSARLPLPALFNRAFNIFNQRRDRWAGVCRALAPQNALQNRSLFVGYRLAVCFAVRRGGLVFVWQGGLVSPRSVACCGLAVFAFLRSGGFSLCLFCVFRLCCLPLASFLGLVCALRRLLCSLWRLLSSLWRLLLCRLVLCVALRPALSLSLVGCRFGFRLFAFSGVGCVPARWFALPLVCLLSLALVRGFSSFGSRVALAVELFWLCPFFGGLSCAKFKKVFRFILIFLSDWRFPRK